MKFLSRLKSVDFYKKLPSDLSEATLTGAWISIAAAILIATLIGLELADYVTLRTKSEMIVSRSRPGELLRVNFNIRHAVILTVNTVFVCSFPALSCEFATVDVSDALGTKKINLTKTVRKTPIDFDLQRAGATLEDKQVKEPKYDEWVEFADVDVQQPINTKNFVRTVNHYPIGIDDVLWNQKRCALVVINFYAPWCPWCQRLEPSWDAATDEVHTKYPESDGRIRLAKVDCTQDVDLCRQHQITGFPSIRVYRKGHDDVYIAHHHMHESYVGDRTKEAIVSFAETLVPSAGQPHSAHPETQKLTKHAGCNMAGFVLTKKVPGTLHFLAKSPGTSFDHSWMNMTHYVHHLYFGTRPSPYRYNFLRKMHPLGLTSDWADKLKGQEFISMNTQSIHEHYVQVVLTTIEAGSGSAFTDYDSYEYTVHSHSYTSDAIPSAKFSFHLSPIQIVVRAQPRELYKFVTSLCAIIGGVFTVAGILDSLVYQGVKIAKKIELGKQN